MMRSHSPKYMIHQLLEDTLATSLTIIQQVNIFLVLLHVSLPGGTKTSANTYRGMHW